MGLMAASAIPRRWISSARSSSRPRPYRSPFRRYSSRSRPADGATTRCTSTEPWIERLREWRGVPFLARPQRRRTRLGAAGHLLIHNGKLRVGPSPTRRSCVASQRGSWRRRSGRRWSETSFASMPWRGARRRPSNGSRSPRASSFRGRSVRPGEDGESTRSVTGPRAGPEWEVHPPAFRTEQPPP